MLDGDDEEPIVIDGEEPETPEVEVTEPEEDDGPVVIRIGDAEPDEDDDDMEVPDDAPKWARRVRDVSEERRKENRELKKRLAELEARVKPVAAEPELGPKPTLLDEDIDGDEDVFEQRILEWHQSKRELETREAKQAEAQKQAEATWNAKVQAYQEGKKTLKVPDFDDAEEVVLSSFDETQKGVLIHIADNPAMLAYAIGKDPKLAKELAAIKDAALFIKAVTQAEGKMTVTTRKPATKPESTVSSTARSGGASTDDKLDKLREEAMRTGDMSKVAAYKRQMAR